jgi:transposase InsO family protein
VLREIPWGVIASRASCAWRGCAAQRFRLIATRRSADLSAAPNRVQRAFHVATPDRLWLADITRPGSPTTS